MNPLAGDVLADEHSQLHRAASPGAENNHSRSELIAKTLRLVAEGSGIGVHLGGDDLDAVDVSGGVGEVTGLLAGHLSLELVQLPLQSAAIFLELDHGLGEGLWADLELGGSDGSSLVPHPDPGEGTGTGDGFNATHTGSSPALGGDAHQADVSSGLHMGATAQLCGEARH